MRTTDWQRQSVPTYIGHLQTPAAGTRSIHSASGWGRRTGLALTALLALVVFAPEASASLPPLMPESEEIEAALEGAPPHLRAKAGVFVLKATGYVRVRDTRNGFTCLLLREWARSFEPTCFDPEGTASILPVVLFRTELLARGMKESAIQAAVAEGYATGRFRAPQRVGVAYMLSERNVVVLDHEAQKVGPVPPHLMFYSPYLKNDDFGVTDDQRFHFTISEPGTPRAMIIVPVSLDSETHRHE